MRWMTKTAPLGGEEAGMLELGIVVLVVAGAAWLSAALLGGIFKLVFGLLGVLFGGFVGLLVLGAGALLVLPLLFAGLLTLLLPALCVAGLVWLVVRAARPAATAPTDMRTG